MSDNTSPNTQENSSAQDNQQSSNEKNNNSIQQTEEDPIVRQLGETASGLKLEEVNKYNY